MKVMLLTGLANLSSASLKRKGKRPMLRSLSKMLIRIRQTVYSLFRSNLQKKKSGLEDVQKSAASENFVSLRKETGMNRKETGMFAELQRMTWDYQVLDEGRVEAFLKQARRMESYEEDGPVPDTDYYHAYVGYQEMTTDELHHYFAWRTKLRRGEAVPYRTGFILLHAAELINLIGVGNMQEAFESLLRLMQTGQPAGSGLAGSERYLGRLHTGRDGAVSERSDAGLAGALSGRSGAYPSGALPGRNGAGLAGALEMAHTRQGGCMPFMRRTEGGLNGSCPILFWSGGRRRKLLRHIAFLIWTENRRTSPFCMLKSPVTLPSIR